MALWEDVTNNVGKSWSSNILLGAALVVLAPAVAPAVIAGLRPLAKAAIKGGVMAYDKTRELMAEAGEQISDLVAEARSEMTTAAAAASAASTAQDNSSEAPVNEASFES